MFFWYMNVKNRYHKKVKIDAHYEYCIILHVQQRCVKLHYEQYNTSQI